MSVIVHIPNHVDLALADLPEQYKGKTKLSALISISAARTQELEDAFYSILSSGSIATDEGNLLDMTGEIVVQSRMGLSDILYRPALLAKIAENVSNGTSEELISIFKLLMQADKVYFQDIFPAGLAMTAVDTDPLGTSQAINKAVKSAMEAGVRLDYLAQAPAHSFSFSDDPDLNGLGLGDFNDPSVGGYLASIF